MLHKKKTRSQVHPGSPSSQHGQERMVTRDAVHAHSTRLSEKKMATAALTAAPGLCDYRNTGSPPNISFSVLLLADSLQA